MKVPSLNYINLIIKEFTFFAYQHCRDEELSKDIVQNTFMEVYKSRENLRKNEAFYSWMLQIAYYQVIKNVGKEAKKKSLCGGVDDIENFLDSSTDEIEKQVENKEVIKTIYDCIEVMKPAYKEVAVLRYYYELTTREIATVLSIAIGTAKSRTYRVNRIIQKDLRAAGLAPDISHSSAIFTMIVPSIMKAVESSENMDSISNMNEVIIDTVGKTITAIESQIFGTKLILGLSASAVIGGTAYLTTTQNSSNLGSLVMDNILQEVEYDSRIKDIVYNPEYTSESIDITVQTSNDNYDQILINGEESLTINENGLYEVTLLKEGNVIDQKQLEINNFDYDSPELISVEKVEDRCIIKMEDKGSGLNYESIKYYYNGELSSNYTVDKTSNTIIFNYQNYSSNIFYIEDIVGNWREVKVVSDNV
ncbi:MAG: RNA polymerase sigma factor [Coprobacillaceae bacterium]